MKATRALQMMKMIWIVKMMLKAKLHFLFHKSHWDQDQRKLRRWPLMMMMYSATHHLIQNASTRKDHQETISTTSEIN